MGDIQIYSSAYAINSAQHEDPLLHTKTTVGENCTENEGRAPAPLRAAHRAGVRGSLLAAVRGSRPRNKASAGPAECSSLPVYSTLRVTEKCSTRLLPAGLWTQPEHSSSHQDIHVPANAGSAGGPATDVNACGGTRRTSGKAGPSVWGVWGAGGSTQGEDAGRSRPLPPCKLPARSCAIFPLLADLQSPFPQGSASGLKGWQLPGQPRAHPGFQCCRIRVLRPRDARAQGTGNRKRAGGRGGATRLLQAQAPLPGRAPRGTGRAHPRPGAQTSRPCLRGTRRAGRICPALASIVSERNLETCDSFLSGLISCDVGFVLHLLSLLPPSTPEEEVEASEDLVICPQTTDKGLAKHGAGS